MIRAKTELAQHQLRNAQYKFKGLVFLNLPQFDGHFKKGTIETKRVSDELEEDI